MRFVHSFTSHENRYALGVDQNSGGLYLSIPVGSQLTDYEEYYTISTAEHAAMSADPAAAKRFADECRAGWHDDRLILKPGTLRGTPR